MPLVKVASLSQLPAGSVMEVAVGNNTYVVCNAGGRITALSGVCQHRGGPLGQGVIHGNRVVCPWHAWEWDCQTGANDYDPTKRVPCFEVQIQGEDILIQVP
jgi:nitrite reductase (NADH) small subunit